MPVPHDDLERTAIEWARLVNEKITDMLQRMLKFSFNLIDDGLVGQQIFAGEATRLAYMTDEAQEETRCFLEKRPMNFKKLSLVLLNTFSFESTARILGTFSTPSGVQRCILIGLIDGGESNTLTT